jgi:predicted ATPase
LQLDLIVALVKDCAIEGFAVVGACQTEEMSPEHHLAVRLREMESDSVLVTDVMMGDLDMAGLTDLLAALLKTKPAAVVDLARIVKQITGGNPFFTLHLLRTMYEKELVSLALDTGEWTWETFGVICRTTHCDTVRSLLLVQIKSLPPEILAVLTTAAVLGEEIDELLLKEVCRDHEVHEALDYVADRDLLVRHEQSNVWRFAHNQVRQSLYDMILESDHEKFHLDIGKHLLSNLDEQGLKKHCGFVVNEIRLGAGLLLHEEEREQISLFCLHSGEQAALSSRFTTAASHFEFGIELLSNRHWRDQYSLSLSLYNAAAEVEYCCADFLRVHKLIDEVKCNARNEDDKIRVRTLSIYSYGSQNMITLGTIQVAWV